MSPRNAKPCDILAAISCSYTKCLPQVFDLQLQPTEDHSSDVVVSGHPLTFKWDNAVARSHQSISLKDTSGAAHQLDLFLTGAALLPQTVSAEYDATHQFVCFVTSVDGRDYTTSAQPLFALSIRSTSPGRLMSIAFDWGSHVLDFDKLSTLPTSSRLSPASIDDEPMKSHTSDSFDLAAELESLRLLEYQAGELQNIIAAKHHVLSEKIKQHRNSLCLKHLIKECDGVVCAAKAITQRLCDMVGIRSRSSCGYAKVKNSHIEHMIAFGENHGVHSAGADAAGLPLMLTKNGSTHTFRPIDLVNPPNPVLGVLEALAAILGLVFLFKLLRRKCMSVRKRVERDADREERRNERAYRRAARRALMRKRWDGFTNTFNCFGRQEEPRLDDYEEKRALILQDAFLEQDLDQAEKGEVMEAEIRELRYAHEIVSSLVRADGENRYDLITPINDHPPPLVPLPYTPMERSRASTYTLPSYTSESLPDYSSTPEDTTSSSSVVIGFTPSISNDGNSEYRPTPPTSESSGRSRFTPNSSVLETSPRASEETLRTRQSRETRRS